MAEEKWTYERLREDGKIEYCPMNDMDGKITGRMIYGLKAWFDEHPEERKQLGWIKHIQHPTKDIEFNRQTQYLTKMLKRVDEYTVEDEYTVMDKSPEMMRLEELTQGQYYAGTDYVVDDETGGVIFE